MRAYQLPDKTWIDLDQIQTIGCVFKTQNQYQCEVRLMFQDEPQNIDLTSWYSVFKFDSETFSSRQERMAQRAYEKLLAAWKNK